MSAACGSSSSSARSTAGRSPPTSSATSSTRAVTGSMPVPEQVIVEARESAVGIGCFDVNGAFDAGHRRSVRRGVRARASACSRRRTSPASSPSSTTSELRSTSATSGSRRSSASRSIAAASTRTPSPSRSSDPARRNDGRARTTRAAADLRDRLLSVQCRDLPPRSRDRGSRRHPGHDDDRHGTRRSAVAASSPATRTRHSSCATGWVTRSSRARWAATCPTDST